MWQEKQAKLLRDEIEELLTPLSSIADFNRLVEEPLKKAGRGLAIGAARDQPWCLLPLIVSEAISGHYRHVLPAAAALQFLMAAGDVFDDVEDADSSESLSSKYGLAVATNVATTLLILAERAIGQLKAKGVEDCIIIRVMKMVNSFYTTACAGQHLDLSLTSEMATSEDIYLQVIGMKSASQIECACHIGALLAEASQQLIHTFAMFGHNVGMVAQISNDIQGITRGRDLMKRKITMPIIYALTQTGGQTRNRLESIFFKQSESTLDPAQIRSLLFRIGAMHYATVKMEFYRQRASDILAEVEQAGASVKRLKLFLK
ncbi:polyprenyl synthetase family protein [Chloroflexota bacterium]